MREDCSVFQALWFPKAKSVRISAEAQGEVGEGPLGAGCRVRSLPREGRPALIVEALGLSAENYTRKKEEQD